MDSGMIYNEDTKEINIRFENSVKIVRTAAIKVI